MRKIECSGTPREMGRQTGEALREDIRFNLQIRQRWNPEEWKRRLPVFVDTTRTHLPAVLEEMDGIADGAGVAPEDIYGFNFPPWNNELDLEDCTNLVFSDGPDGPVWGKNNDGVHSARPLRPCVRHVKPAQGIPQIGFGFCGWVSTADGMNAEGLAVGHSSVGSVFQQSDRNPFIRLWEYDARSRCRTVPEFVQRMTSIPLRGKGYSMVCVDRSGTAVSIEAACPIVQIRKPNKDVGIHCVNFYQLPALANADRRRPDAKLDAMSRAAYLDNVLDGEGPFDVEHMKRVLRNHDGQDICRHGSDTCEHNTEYSMIGIPRQGKVLYTAGRPCEEEYKEIS